MSLGEYNGEHYGIPTNINLKSMVWYPKAEFDKAGYTVPDDVGRDAGAVATRSSPTAARRGASASRAAVPPGGRRPTGWRTSCSGPPGLDTYDAVGEPRDPVQRPGRACTPAKVFGDIMFHPGYVLGGADQTPAIAFGDAPLPMFDNPPGCWLHRQASFINAFFPEDGEAGSRLRLVPASSDRPGRDAVRR